MASLILTIEVFDNVGAKRAGKPFEVKYGVGQTYPEQWDTTIKLLGSIQKVLEKRKPKEGEEIDDT